MMNTLKHVILGSNGIVGTEIHKALKTTANDIKLVNRTAHPSLPIEVADLLDLKQTVQAVKNYDIVYLTAGVTYDASAWKQYWPTIMENVITATLDAGARLVFVDNVYMYGKVDGWMTENTPFNPISKKGEVRAQLAEKILNAITHKNLTALIARCADFYGFTNMSIPNILVFENLHKNANPLILLNKESRHSFTYVKDIGSSVAFLAQDERNFGQTWHLPTDSNVLTAGDFAKLASQAMGKDLPATVLTKEIIGNIAQQDAFVMAYQEMLYQNEFDYLFSSQKYEQTFQKSPTPYASGVKELAAVYRN